MVKKGRQDQPNRIRSVGVFLSLKGKKRSICAAELSVVKRVDLIVVETEVFYLFRSRA